MSNNNAFHNLYIQGSFVRDKIVKFLGKTPLVLSSQCSNFVHKIENIVGIKKKKRWGMKKSCAYYLIQIGFTLRTNALKP
jgi:hypothetical protein